MKIARRSSHYWVAVKELDFHTTIQKPHILPCIRIVVTCFKFLNSNADDDFSHKRCKDPKLPDPAAVSSAAQGGVQGGRLQTPGQPLPGFGSRHLTRGPARLLCRRSRVQLGSALPILRRAKKPCLAPRFLLFLCSSFVYCWSAYRSSYT